MVHFNPSVFMRFPNKSYRFQTMLTDFFHFSHLVEKTLSMDPCTKCGVAKWHNRCFVFVFVIDEELEFSLPFFIVRVVTRTILQELSVIGIETAVLFQFRLRSIANGFGILDTAPVRSRRHRVTGFVARRNAPPAFPRSGNSCGG